MVKIVLRARANYTSYHPIKKYLAQNTVMHFPLTGYTIPLTGCSHQNINLRQTQLPFSSKISIRSIFPKLFRTAK